MSLNIRHNMMSLMAQRNLGTTYGKMGESINALSSGLRINSADDDAAGLAVREQMRAQVAALDQGVRNANDAISMLQTMDGAAQVIDEKLVRMKELAEQAATGTYSNDQRAIMNDEFAAMRDEIERIAQSTEFNNIKMLNASSGGTAQVIEYNAGTDVTSATAAVDVFSTFASGETVTLTATETDGTLVTANLSVTSSTTLKDVADAVNAITSVTASYGDTFQLADDETGKSSLDLQISDAAGTDTGVYDFSVAEEGTNGQTNIHFGVNNNPAEDYYAVNKQDFTTAGLGIDSLSIANQESAQAALDTLDTAITQKDTGRAHFGAMMNRLKNTVTATEIQREKIQAAEAQISDVDVASEMAELTRNQVLAQAGISMLAQANIIPQMATMLLQG